jgi:hypothetical protein
MNKTLRIIGWLTICAALAAPTVYGEWQQGQAMRLIDHNGREALNTTFGDRIMTLRHPEIEVQFQYNIATYDATITNVGSGSATQSNASAVLATTTAAGSSLVESNRTIRYAPGYEGIVLFTAAFTSTVPADGYSRIGLGNAGNGFYVERTSTGWGVCRRHATTDSCVDIASADPGLPEGCSVSIENLNLFRVSYGWLGIAPISYAVWCGGTVGWGTFHVIDLHGAQAGPHTTNPVLPMFAEVSNGATESVVTLQTSSWSASIADGAGATVNHCPIGSRSFSHTDTITASTTENSVFGLLNQTTFQSIDNQVTWRLLSIGGIKDGTSGLFWQIHRNATVTSASYTTDVDAVNSTAAADTAGTTFATQGIVELGGGLSGNSGDFSDISSQDIRVRPGENVDIGLTTSAGTGVSTITLRWCELF